MKNSPEEIASIFYPLIKATWEQESMPEESKKGVLVKVQKKGDLSVCNSYEGITLLFFLNKVLSKITLERMTTI